MTLAFFRRHRKWFMVLMFAALISMVFFGSWSYMPRLREWLGSEGPRRVVGTIAGRDVRAGEVGDFVFGIRLAGEASQAFAMMLDGEDKPMGARQSLYGLTVGMSAWPLLSQSLAAERVSMLTYLTWYALYLEAEQHGFDTSEAEVEARLEALAGLGLTPELLRQTLSRQRGVQRSHLVAGLRQDMTLRSYLNFLVETLGGAVEPELRREFAKMDERIKVRLIVLKAEDAVEGIKDVPEDELTAQFEKYKQFLPGQSPEGYGYRIPDKAAIEYLVAEPAAFEAEAAPKVTDARIQEYYDAQKDPQFVVPEEKPAEGKDEKADASEAKAPEKKFRPLDEVRDEIRKKLVRQEAERLARDLLTRNVSEIRPVRPAPKLAIYADGRKVRHVAVPGLHAAQELGAIEPIGQAARGNAGLPDYALSVVDLVGADKARMSLMEISDVFLCPAGEAVAFRVTSVEKNHEPAALDDVRDKVLADVKAAKAFQAVRDRGKVLLEAASAKGLEAAAKDAGLEPLDSEWFPRERAIPYGGRWLSFPPSLPEVGADRLVVAECFRMAADKRQRTLVTLGQKQVVVVAELVDRKAPREAAYAEMRPLVASRVEQELGQGALAKVLDMSAIQRRMMVLPAAVEETRGRGAGGEAPAPDATEE